MPEATGETWGEKLGFPGDARVLILHADDLGMCHEANAAGRAYLEAGHIQSASVMVPCPWFEHFAAWARAHPEHDLGLHLTLTSEWKHYRWGPVADRREVPGLLDPQGYLWPDVIPVALAASPTEVEREIRAQVERALARGLKPTHLDSHMGTLFATAGFAEAYLKVAREYGIPAMVIELTPRVIEHYRRQGYPLDDEMIAGARRYPGPKLDALLPLPQAESYAQLKERFRAQVRGLPPGITQLLFHPARESPALQAITNSWRQRVWEGRLFADPEIQAFLAEEGVLFTSWRELARRFAARRTPPATEAPPPRRRQF